MFCTCTWSGGIWVCEVLLKRLHHLQISCSNLARSCLWTALVYHIVDLPSSLPDCEGAWAWNTPLRDMHSQSVSCWVRWPWTCRLLSVFESAVHLELCGSCACLLRHFFDAFATWILQLALLPALHLNLHFNRSHCFLYSGSLCPGYVFYSYPSSPSTYWDVLLSWMSPAKTLHLQPPGAHASVQGALSRQ